MLQQVTENVWFDECDLFMPGGMYFSCRMTIVRLAGGGLWVHSPIQIDAETEAQIKELGTVEHIVAPSKFHHLFAGDFQKRFPGSTLYAAPGLDKKRADLSFDEVLKGQAVEAWSEDFAYLVLGGVPACNEVVFFHKPSQSLIVTDLLFNIYEVKGRVAPLVLRLVGAWKKPAQSRLLKFATRDRKAAAASVREMQKWDFQRVIMAHGKIIEDDAQNTFEHAMAWMLKG